MTGPVAVVDVSSLAPSTPRVSELGKYSRIQRYVGGSPQWLTLEPDERSGRYWWTTAEEDALEFQEQDKLALELTLDMAKTVNLPVLY